MPPRREEIDEEMKTNKKRNRPPEIQEAENKGKEIIRYDQQDYNNHFFFRPPHLLNLIQQLLLPWRMKKKIDDDMGGHHHDIKLVIEKKICRSDLSFGFLFPENRIMMEARDFLKPHEVEHLKKISTDENKPQIISVLMLDQNLQEFDFVLCWRQMNSIYNLRSDGWNDVVQRNKLKLYDMVQLWSFRRVSDQLGFAIVKISQ